MSRAPSEQWHGCRSRRGEAAMQSRRVRVPLVEPVCALAELVGRTGLVVADRLGRAPGDLTSPPPPGWTLLVGPEGGFAPGELDAIEPVGRVSFGPYVLRAGTAPIAAVAVLADRARALRPE